MPPLTQRAPSSAQRPGWGPGFCTHSSAGWGVRVQGSRGHRRDAGSLGANQYTNLLMQLRQCENRRPQNNFRTRIMVKAGVPRGQPINGLVGPACVVRQRRAPGQPDHVSGQDVSRDPWLPSPRHCQCRSPSALASAARRRFASGFLTFVDLDPPPSLLRSGGPSVVGIKLEGPASWLFSQALRAYNAAGSDS